MIALKNNICYLDNAATSFPKPQNVIKEITRCISSYCGNAGRGSHSISLYSANKIYDCREAVCSLVNAPSPESIVFVPSCTYAINLVIKGFLRHGDHVIISDAEHNAVLRPLERLKTNGIITYDVFPALARSKQSDEDLLLGIEKRIQKNTRLIICNHQSNICSYYLPIKKIGNLCKKYGIALAIDGAQSLGHLEVDMKNMNISYLCAAAHKGLYGIQGGSFLAVNSTNTLETLVEGGSGINSLDSQMPIFLPERHEAGTLPLPSIVGLYEGIKFLNSITLEEVRNHEKELFKKLCDGLLNIKGTTVYQPDFPGSTLLFNIENSSAERIGALLDKKGICVRVGFHCTALAHRSLSTTETGAVRVSFGLFNTSRDVDRLLSVVNKL